MKIQRKITLPPENIETFFLWGPRQTGKSTLLKEAYPNALWIDLLKADEYRRYLENPEKLRQELRLKPDVKFIVIDEIQKVPQLLDEVHWLIENANCAFALCGSSARKLKRGHANLLGGRAIRYELFGFVSAELDKDQFDLTRMLNHGYLPRHYLAANPKRMLNSYVGEYLKEEIAAEGLTRNLPLFSNFLNLASLSDTETISFSSFARDCGVSAPTIKTYFDILADTLLGHWLPAYRSKPKRKTKTSPKFYFSDVGVVNFLAKRSNLQPGSELYGKAFENWVFHELMAYNNYQERFAELSYWKLLDNKAEVDFIVNDVQVAIEVKSSSKIHRAHLLGLRTLRQDFPKAKRMIVVCLEPKSRITDDGIEILNVDSFRKSLWRGELF